MATEVEEKHYNNFEALRREGNHCLMVLSKFTTLTIMAYTCAFVILTCTLKVGSRYGACRRIAEQRMQSYVQDRTYFYHCICSCNNAEHVCYVHKNTVLCNAPLCGPTLRLNLLT